jgi:segregation and condensation protein B
MGGDDNGADDGADSAGKAPADQSHVRQGAVNPSVTDALAAAVSGRRKAAKKTNKNLKPVAKEPPVERAVEPEAADAPVADAPVADVPMADAPGEAAAEDAGGDAGPVGGGSPDLAEVASTAEVSASTGPVVDARPTAPEEGVEGGPVGGETPNIGQVAMVESPQDGEPLAAAADAVAGQPGQAPAVDGVVGAADGALATESAAGTGGAGRPDDAGATAGDAATGGDGAAAGDAATGAGAAGATGDAVGGDAAVAGAEGSPVAEAAPIPGADEAAVETTSLAEYRQAQEPAAVVEEVVVPDAADLPAHELRAAVESLLFVSTKPLSVAKLAGCLPGTSAGYLEGFLAGLAARYDHERRGWELLKIANGWQLLTRKELHPWVRQLDRKELPTKLTKGALETLAIVAYKQPIARGAIEDIRGVQCGPVLRQLMDMKLVQVTGRDDHLLGRPLLYGTTEQFLQRFGLGGLDALPAEHEFGA